MAQRFAPRRFMVLCTFFSMIAILMSTTGCSKLEEINFTFKVNDRQMRVKGIQGLKDLVTGRLRYDSETWQEAAARREENAAREASNRQRARAPKPEYAMPYPMVDLTPLGSSLRRDRAKSEALVGRVVLCDIVGIINREDVGDKHTKAGLKLVKGVKIGKLYSRLYCRKNARAKRGVEVHCFLPAKLARSIDWLRMGRKVNLKLLGIADRNFYGLVKSVVSPPRG